MHQIHPNSHKLDIWASPANDCVTHQATASAVEADKKRATCTESMRVVLRKTSRHINLNHNKCKCSCCCQLPGCSTQYTPPPQAAFSCLLLWAMTPSPWHIDRRVLLLWVHNTPICCSVMRPWPIMPWLSWAEVWVMMLRVHSTSMGCYLLPWWALHPWLREVEVWCLLPWVRSTPVGRQLLLWWAVIPWLWRVDIRVMLVWVCNSPICHHQLMLCKVPSRLLHVHRCRLLLLLPLLPPLPPLLLDMVAVDRWPGHRHVAQRVLWLHLLRQLLWCGGDQLLGH